MTRRASKEAGVGHPVTQRELRRRRVLLLVLSALLLLSISPVLGHHLLESVPWLSASQQHLWLFCLVALHALMAPVHEVFHLLLAAGVIFAALDRGRALWRHIRLMRALDVERVDRDSQFGIAAARVGLDLGRVRVVVGLPNPAFTTGWLAPRIFVASDLARRLSPDELEAVLAHEAVHLRRRDPLRLFLLRTLSAILFWMPALGRVSADIADEWEITADDEAAQTHALPLASAILRMAGTEVEAADPAVGFQRQDLLPRRIRRLAGEDPDLGSHLSRRSVVAAGVALALAWSSGVMVLHPLAEAGADPTIPSHCPHREAWPLSHLFCRGLIAPFADGACPHADDSHGTEAGH